VTTAATGNGVGAARNANGSAPRVKMAERRFIEGMRDGRVRA